MGDMNIEQARHNMIEQQIRPWEVLDQRVLGILENAPREDFVPEDYRNLAFADLDIPLGHGQVMMAPKLEARMLQALNIKPTDVVLEIGTGSGYTTALLAKLGRHVLSVDIFPEFTESAGKKLAAQNIQNVTLETGDASSGWERHAPYDAIAITGSLPILPEPFQQSLNTGGRLFCIVGESPVMSAILITRVGEHKWAHETLFETNVPALLNAPSARRFVL